MIKKDILPNGLRIVTQQLTHLNSVSVGIWVGVGSAHEKEGSEGVSHFLEHMLFKGTEKRDAKEIVQTMEAVGGHINAFTAKEKTCYYTKCLGEDFGMAIDILQDIFNNSILDEEEFEKEKHVILEEINMYEDTPDDLVHDLFASTLWPEHTYGLPIIGSPVSIRGLTATQLKNYYKRAYLPQNTVISVAGNISHEEVLEAARRFFMGFTREGEKTYIDTPCFFPSQTFRYKDIEQMHLCIGIPGCAEYSGDYYPFQVLNTVIGGTAGSRLFQEAREKRGLAYSIYSYNSSYSQGGYWAVSSSTSPAKLREILDVIISELQILCERGLTDQEIAWAKHHLRGSIMLSYDNSSNVMMKNGGMELSMGKSISADVLIGKIMAVEREDIRRILDQYFKKELFSLALVGREQIEFNIK